jgi:uncharacterized cupin superfamily protein
MCLASIVMTEAIAPPGDIRVVDFASTQPETSVNRPAADRLLDGTPEETVRNYFTDRGGRFFAGIWESTPGRWRVRYTENEFCHMTRGRVRIADASGRQWTFKAGDTSGLRRHLGSDRAGREALRDLRTRRVMVHAESRSH